jgi:hypothetical protein
MTIGKASHVWTGQQKYAAMVISFEPNVMERSAFLWSRENRRKKLLVASILTHPFHSSLTHHWHTATRGPILRVVHRADLARSLGHRWCVLCEMVTTMQLLAEKTSVCGCAGLRRASGYDRQRFSLFISFIFLGESCACIAHLELYVFVD